MRNKTLYALFLLSNFFFISSISIGQIDTSYIIEKEVIETNLPDTFNYFQQATLVDKKSQFVIAFYHNLFGVEYSNWQHDDYYFEPVAFGLNVYYEKKIFNYFSIKPSLIFTRGIDTYNNYMLNMEFRYYFSLNKRMKMLETGNSFAGSYIGFRQINLIRESDYWTDKAEWNFDKGVWDVYKTKEYIYYPLIEVNFGRQFEIKKRIIIDVNLGPVLNIKDLKNFRAGHGEISIGYSF